MNDLNMIDVPIAPDTSSDDTGFLFSFGAYGDTHVVVMASHLEEGLEVALEWLDGNAPGLLTAVDEQDYRDAAKELGLTGWGTDGALSSLDESRVLERAEQDMTMVTHTTLKNGNAIPSWEWTVRELAVDELTIVKARLVHWTCGGGQPGCLYDYGPEACATKAEAIESLVFVYGDELTEEELVDMKNDLERQHIHYFPSDARERAGASYCELSEQCGEMPEGD